jgi:putative nucleotidyltransferase with HDIG domain
MNSQCKESSVTNAADLKLKQERLISIIEDELQDLPSLPAVVVRVMQSLNNPKTSAADLNQIISSDQALTAKLLRLVNSPYYGFPRRITTITHAVVILGQNTVRNLTMSLGVSGIFEQQSNHQSLDREAFWQHSMAVAVAAQSIAKRRRLSVKQTEEVFVGGLLHDIGKLFLDQYFPDQYAVTLKLARQANISVWEAEKAALGIGHIIVGKRIAERWSLPPCLVNMIAMHHQPLFARDYTEQVWTIHAANYIAQRLNLGSGGGAAEPQIAAEVASWLGFDQPAWQNVERETTERFVAASDFIKMVSGANREMAAAA